MTSWKEWMGDTYYERDDIHPMETNEVDENNSFNESNYFFDGTSPFETDIHPMDTNETDKNESLNESRYFFDDTSPFKTNKVFNSRQELMDWVQNMANTLGYVIVIKNSKRNFNVVFQCDRGVEDLLKKNVKPKDILSALKNLNPKNVSTLKTIYNADEKLRRREREEDLFFAHPRSLEIWRAFPHVLLMDATYKTNKYGMPLLEIVGVTPTNMTFSIAFVYMHEEKQSNYVWALDCLKSVMEGCMLPRVIVTDREMALMNAYTIIFPDAKGLLCRWHINNNIMKKCKSCWDVLYTSWTRLVNSETKEAYNKNLAQVEKTTNNYPDAYSYLNKTWLTPHKEKFVSAWTDKFLNFGNHTTNRAESQHAKLKRYVETSRSDIAKSLKRIADVVESQYTDKFWKKLDLLECKSLEDDNLGCAVEVNMFNAHYEKQSRPVKLSLARKLLNLITPSTTSVSEPATHKNTRGCPSLKKKPFKKTHIDLNHDPPTQHPPPQDQPTQAPPTQYPSRRSISTYTPDYMQSNLFDLNQEPDRHSTYSFREPPMFNSTFNQEQSMHSSYFNQEQVMYNSDPLMNEIPYEFHPYVTNIQNVRGDGNYGFRAIAACLGYSEDNWRQIRLDLQNELLAHPAEYAQIFYYDLNTIHHSLNFNGSHFALTDHWLIMPVTSFLIANKYNIIVIFLSKDSPSTCFPLWLGPQDISTHRVVVIALVRGDHYVKVDLHGAYQMPTILPLWRHNRSSRSAGWETVYAARLNSYISPFATHNNCNNSTVIISDN
ncbi:uncharacterized protein LOC128125935 [Lactuca sativa]|uniref:uncharacterized protein LOC128125935 n=1 Tax=Lactuca sativa TaxID=4236 RepID=UPI0022B01676|nr:uncharacterized protein LOC128125935 [Lactuca sativa]